MKARNDHIYFSSSLIFQDFSEESISPKGSDMGKIFLSYNNINILNRNRWILCKTSLFLRWIENLHPANKVQSFISHDHGKRKQNIYPIR